MGRGEGDTEAGQKPLADELDRLEKEVEKRQTKFELRSAGKSDVERAEIALSLGLGGKALEVLEKTDWTKIDDKDPNKLLGVKREMSLMLRTGRAEEVRKELAVRRRRSRTGWGPTPTPACPPTSGCASRPPPRPATTRRRIGGWRRSGKGRPVRPHWS